METQPQLTLRFRDRGPWARVYCLGSSLFLAYGLGFGSALFDLGFGISILDSGRVRLRVFGARGLRVWESLGSSAAQRLLDLINPTKKTLQHPIHANKTPTELYRLIRKGFWIARYTCRTLPDLQA